jgi:hypothetical protein
MSNPEHPEPDFSTAILEYLARHPQAEDTAEGIALFWIPQGSAQVEIARIQRDLDSLTMRGLLEKRGTGETTRYRRAVPHPGGFRG